MMMRQHVRQKGDVSPGIHQVISSHSRATISGLITETQSASLYDLDVGEWALIESK